MLRETLKRDIRQIIEIYSLIIIIKKFFLIIIYKIKISKFNIINQIIIKRRIKKINKDLYLELKLVKI